MASIVTGYFVELITLFAIVFVHELGHVAAARGLGWNVLEVKLLPFGGVAEVEEAGSLPSKEEAIVAIAGPLQNLWMGILAWSFGQLGVWNGDWSDYVWRANLMIGLFNLLPILPLDGGKLMQAALSQTLAFHQTLVWGIRISLVLSAIMIGYSIIPMFHMKQLRHSIKPARGWSVFILYQLGGQAAYSLSVSSFSYQQGGSFLPLGNERGVGASDHHYEAAYRFCRTSSIQA